MYVAVKAGEAAIRNAHRLLAHRRRGDRTLPALTIEQIAEQLALGVDRVMAEGSLYDPSLAALAVKQARGDLIEAIFLLRAFRTTLPRFQAARPIDTGSMQIERRVSATYKDLPGGQLLGATFDYTHRLLDPSLATDELVPEVERRQIDTPGRMPRVSDLLGDEGLIEADGFGPDEPGDITRDPTDHPAGRDLRLQTLARGDEGFLLALGYSTQRGYGRTHPFVGEIRIGLVDIEVELAELGFPVTIGRVRVTECQMVAQFTGGPDEPAKFSRGYGLVFGQSERKAMSMSLVDRALRADEFGEERRSPAQDEEFVMAHCDNVAATGFVEHLKLPHYVDFQAELDLVRRLNETRTEVSRSRTDCDARAQEAAE